MLNTTINAVLAAALAFLVTPGQTITRAAGSVLAFFAFMLPLWRLKSIDAEPEKGQLLLTWFFGAKETIEVAPPFSIEKQGAKITLKSGKKSVDVGRRPIIPVKTVWLEAVAEKLNALEWRGEDS